jgi:hypothetical protein
MSKTHDKTPELLLGASKVVRAVRDVTYQGTVYRGRKREQVDEPNGGYHSTKRTQATSSPAMLSLPNEPKTQGKLFFCPGGE